MSADYVKERLQSKLDSLGDTAEAIRKFLVDRGIKGFCGVSKECPIAEFLKQEGFVSPLVSANIAVCTEVDLELKVVAIKAPHAVLDFMVFFDQDNYPELIRQY